MRVPGADGRIIIKSISHK